MLSMSDGETVATGWGAQWKSNMRTRATLTYCQQNWGKQFVEHTTVLITTFGQIMNWTGKWLCMPDLEYRIGTVWNIFWQSQGQHAQRNGQLLGPRVSGEEESSLLPAPPASLMLPAALPGATGEMLWGSLLADEGYTSGATCTWVGGHEPMGRGGKRGPGNSDAPTQTWNWLWA